MAPEEKKELFIIEHNIIYFQYDEILCLFDSMDKVIFYYKIYRSEVWSTDYSIVTLEKSQSRQKFG